VAGDGDLDTVHIADAGHDRGGQREIGAPGCERAQLEERAVAVQQEFDPLTNHEFPAFMVALDVLLATTGSALGHEALVLGQHLEVRRPGLGEIGGRRIDARGDDRHGPRT
jgi:hypothetical protein